jgi:hypothetical protein
VNRVAIRTVLAALDISHAELAELLGFERGYVNNVLSGCSRVTPGFRRALGDVLAQRLLAPRLDEGRTTYPPGPLQELCRERMKRYPSPRSFYAATGVSSTFMSRRQPMGVDLADRYCMALNTTLEKVYPLGADWHVNRAGEWEVA